MNRLAKLLLLSLGILAVIQIDANAQTVTPLPYQQIPKHFTEIPYGYVGQLSGAQRNPGELATGTAFPVDAGVCLTAAHTVWDRNTLEFSAHRYRPQQDVNLVSPPAPRSTLGVIAWTGYSDLLKKRQPSNSDVQFVNAEGRLDAATVIFFEHGHTDWGEIDPDSSLFNLVESTETLKLIIGYPNPDLLGRSEAPGTPFATSEFTTRASVHPPDSNSPSSLVQFDGVKTVSGNSGGPVLTFSNGSWQYSGIYVGGGPNSSYVRTIDSDIDHLIDASINLRSTTPNFWSIHPTDTHALDKVIETFSATSVELLNGEENIWLRHWIDRLYTIVDGELEVIASSSESTFNPSSMAWEKIALNLRSNDTARIFGGLDDSEEGNPRFAAKATPYFFDGLSSLERPNLDLSNRIILRNPTRTPISPTVGDTVTFNIQAGLYSWEKPTQVVLRQRRVGSGGTPATHVMTTGDSPDEGDWLNYSTSITYASEDEWEYWFEAGFDPGDGRTPLYNEFRKNDPIRITVNQSALVVEGWDLTAVEITGTSSIVSPGGTIVTGSARVRNDGDPGNHYYNVPYEYRLLAPTGLPVTSGSGTIPQILAGGQTVSVSLPNLTAGLSVGLYLLEFEVNPSIDEDPSNNVASVNILVTDHETSFTHYVFHNSDWDFFFDLDRSSGVWSPSSHKNYILGSMATGTGPSWIQIRRSNTLSWTKADLEGFTYHNNSTEAIYCNTLVNMSSFSMAGLSFGYRSPSFLSSPSGTEISVVAGTTGEFVFETNSDQFRSTRPTYHDFNSSNFSSWERSLVLENSNRRARYPFVVPSNASPGVYRTNLLLRLNNNRVLVNNVRIHVSSPVPTITSVQPSPASPGEVIVISGSGFGSSSGGFVSLNGEALAANSWHQAQIQAQLPESAVSGSIRVESTGGVSQAFPITVVSRPKTRIEDEQGGLIHTLNVGNFELGSTVAANLLIRNIGSAPLQFGNLTTVGVPQSIISVANSTGTPLVGPTYSIASGDFITVEIQTTPGSTGAFNGQLLFDSNDPENAQITLSVQGSAVDTTPPAVGFTAPVFSGGETIQASSTIRGFASDLSPIEVFYRLNSGSLQPIELSGQFFEIGPIEWVEGANTLLVLARDSHDNENSAELSVTYVPPLSLNLSVLGGGGGSVFGAGSYKPGTTVEISAFPDDGFEFLRWLEGGSVVSQDPFYSFQIDSGRDLVAEFSEEDDGAEIPTVTTGSVGTVTTNTATAHGTVVETGGAPITARGFVYGSSDAPTLGNGESVSVGGTSGAFSGVLSGLDPSASYFVRAYATNRVGTAYGVAVPFETEDPPSPPEVTTVPVSNVVPDGARVGGDVSSAGSSAVTERGIVFGLLENPMTSSATVVPSGSGLGSFSVDLSGLLEPETTYHVRAYAVNDAGISYGSNVAFATPAEIALPVVTTAEPSNLDPRGAVVGGAVVSAGSSPVAQRGIVFGLAPNPTTSNATFLMSGSGTGEFSVSLAGLLEPDTVYHVRAFAINSEGTSYGANEEFLTPALESPTVEFPTVTNLTGDSVRIGGTVTSDGGDPISERGVVYGVASENPTPVIGAPGVSKVALPGALGTFSTAVSGLDGETTYAFRTYAINGAGVGYSETSQFETLSDSDDGRIDFESDAVGTTPPGWMHGSGPPDWTWSANYFTVVDTVASQGQRSLRFRGAGSVLSGMYLVDSYSPERPRVVFDFLVPTTNGSSGSPIYFLYGGLNLRIINDGPETFNVVPSGVNPPENGVNAVMGLAKGQWHTLVIDLSGESGLASWTVEGTTITTTYTPMISGGWASDFSLYAQHAQGAGGLVGDGYVDDIRFGAAAFAESLTVDPSSWNAPYEGASIEIAVDSNLSWTTESEAEWLMIEAGAGEGNGSFLVTASVNEGVAPRSATITVSGGELERSVSVVQDPAEVLTLSRDSLAAAPSGESVSIGVNSNLSWTAVSDQNWLTVAGGSGTGDGGFAVLAVANPGGERTATVTVSGGGLTRSVAVTQTAAPLLNLSLEAWEADPAGSFGILAVEANVSWTANSNAAWVRVSQGSGTGDGSFGLSASPNPGASRSATVTVTGGGLSRSIPVAQGPGSSDLFIGFEEVPVGETPSGWTHGSGPPNWTWSANYFKVVDSFASEGTRALSFRGAGGSLSGMYFMGSYRADRPQVAFDFFVPTNNGSSGAPIYFIYGGLFLQIINDGPESFHVLPSGVGQPENGVNAVTGLAKGQWHSLVIDLSGPGSNARWNIAGTEIVTPYTARLGGGWASDFSVYAQHAQGAGGIVGQGYIDNIRIGASEFVETISVEPSSWEAPHDGGSTVVTIAANVSWSAESDAEWLTIEGSAGQGDGAFDLTAAANPGSARSATVTLTGQEATTTFSVTQEPAPQLTVAEELWSPAASGGEMSFAVDANVSWTAVSSEGWLSVAGGSGSGDGSFVLTALENDGAERTATVSIIGGGISRFVYVTQEAGPLLEIGTASWEASGSGGSADVTVSSNLSWSASSNANWLGVVNGSGSGDAQLTLVAAPNPGGPRSAEVTITGGGFSRPLLVSQLQGASSLYIGFEPVPVGETPPGWTHGSGPPDWTWSANYFKAVDAFVSEGERALSFRGAGGVLSGMYFSGSYSPDRPRVSFDFFVPSSNGSSGSPIYFIYGGLNLRIINDGPSGFHVVPSGVNPIENGVNSVTDLSKDQWYTLIVDLSGEVGSARWEIAGTEITTPYVERVDGGWASDFSVYAQHAQGAGGVVGQGFIDNIRFSPSEFVESLLVGISSWVAPHEGGSTDVTVAANVPWSAESDAEWVMIEGATGQGDGAFVLNATANSGPARSATVTVTGGGLTNTVEISQSAVELTVDPGSWNAPTAGGSLSVLVTSNLEWSASSNGSWLTLNQASGSGNSTVILTASANNASSPRSATISISGGGQLANISVSQAPSAVTPPDWEAPVGLENSMTVYARVARDGEFLDAPGSLLASFRNDEVRGVTGPIDGPGGIRLYQLTVWSNQPSLAGLSYRIFDAASGEILDIAETLDFVANGVVGTIAAPVTLNVRPAVVEQEIPLVSGWNWISFNALAPESALEGAFAGYVAQDNDLIKGTAGSASYFGGAWYAAPGFDLEPGRMYMLRRQQGGGATLSVTGPPVDATQQIGLVAGWNWLGYLPQDERSVASALAGAALSDDDILKSQQDGTVTYYGGQWFPASTTMKPGRGYLLRVAEAHGFSYDAAPDGDEPYEPTFSLASESEEGAEEVAGEGEGSAAPGWEVPQGRENSMTVYATVSHGGDAIESEGSLLAAFEGDEVAGTVPIMAGPNGQLFQLTVWSDASAFPITFKVFDAAGQEVLEVAETMEFEINGIAGTLGAPLELNVLEISDNADLAGLSLSAGSLDPAFAPETAAYSVVVGNATTSITVTPSAAHPDASIAVRVNGGAYSPVASGSASGALALNVGNNLVEVRVTAEDGESEQVYSVEVFRRTFAPAPPQLHAPEGGTALLQSPGGVTLSWAPEERANWHEIYLTRNGALFLSRWVTGEPEIDGEGNAVFNFNTAELPPGTYQWWVRSFAPVTGAGGWSAPGSFTVACEALGPPAMPGGQTEFEGHWPLALEIEGFETSATWAQFEVLRDGATFKQLWVALAERGRAASYDAETGAGDSTFTILPDGDYQWRARTWSPCHGSSEWSAPQDLSISGTACAGPLAAPGADQIAVDLDHGFSGAEGAGSSPVVTVSPGEVAPATWYHLWIGRAGVGAVLSKWYRYADVYDPGGGAGGSYRLEAGQYLAAGDYLAYVHGFNACGYGAWSVAKPFTVQPPASLEVANLDVAFDGDGALRVLWDVLPGVDWHEVWIGSDGINVLHRWLDGGRGGGGYLKRVEESERAEFRGPAGSAVQAHGNYAFWVRAWTPGGGLGPWASATGTSPVNLTAVPVLEPTVEIEDGNPRIRWNAATAAGGYEIYLSRNGALYHLESLLPEDLVWDEASRTWAGSPPTEYRPYWEPAPGSYQVWVRVQGGTRFGPWSAPVGFVLP